MSELDRMFIAAALELVDGRYGALPASFIEPQDAPGMARDIYEEAGVYAPTADGLTAIHTALADRHNADVRARRTPNAALVETAVAA